MAVGDGRCGFLAFLRRGVPRSHLHHDDMAGIGMGRFGGVILGWRSLLGTGAQRWQRTTEMYMADEVIPALHRIDSMAMDAHASHTCPSSTTAADVGGGTRGRAERTMRSVST